MLPSLRLCWLLLTSHCLFPYLSASQSLAEAKREAAIFGQERREQIRRVVRGMEVEREYERLSMEANAKAADREHRGVELGPSDSQEHL